MTSVTLSNCIFFFSFCPHISKDWKMAVEFWRNSAMTNLKRDQECSWAGWCPSRALLHLWSWSNTSRSLARFKGAGLPGFPARHCLSYKMLWLQECGYEIAMAVTPWSVQMMMKWFDASSFQFFTCDCWKILQGQLAIWELKTPQVYGRWNPCVLFAFVCDNKTAVWNS